MVRGGTLLTLDGAARVLPETDLLAARGRIVAFGPSLEPPAGCRVLDARGCLVLPGLVQGHVHLGQTIFRGLAENRRLLPWLRERIWPLEAAHDRDSAYWSGLLGAAECLLGGTTTVQDIGIGPEADGLLAAIAESGLRAVAGKCLMDRGENLPERLAESTARCLEETEELADRWHGAAEGRLRYGLNPRFALSCSRDLLAGVAEIAARRALPIHTHALEQRAETAEVRRLNAGRDEIELFGDLGLLDADLRIAHGVWLSRRHYRRLAERRFSIVHCPGSNLKLGSGIAKIGRIRAAGIPVGIGCDGPPCNNRLDAFEEVRLAARLQALREGPGALTAVDALRLATSEGARALALEAEIGSLEIGKAADFVVLGLARPELAVASTVEPHERVVYGAAAASVRHVAVGGVVEVEEGQLQRLHLATIVREATRAADRVARRAGLE